MALTETQKAQVRLYLGYSGRWHQTDSVLEKAFTAIATVPEDETTVVTALNACIDIDAKLTDAHGRLKAMKVGSIDLPGHREIEVLRDEGARHVNRMASKLGAPVRHNAFSGTPYTGIQTPYGVVGGGGYGLQG
jgi:hypothetical protein